MFSFRSREEALMAEVTYYVALPILVRADGECYEGEGVECPSPSAAVREAEIMVRRPGIVGSIAFSRTGCLHLGEFDDAEELARFGVAAGGGFAMSDAA
jgi:hypothetical protein